MNQQSILSFICCDLLNVDKNVLMSNSFNVLDCVNNEYYRRLNYLINKSIKGEGLLIISDNIVFTHYKDVVSQFFFRTHTTQGRIIKNRNALMTTSFSLSDSNMRHFFVLLEFLVFKLVHIIIKNCDHNYKHDEYDQEELFGGRIKQLKKASIITNREKNILYHLKEVRNKFAHSVNSLEYIYYRDNSLRDSFGASGSCRLPYVKHFFVDDAFLITTKLIKSFTEVQRDQFDKKEFILAIERLKRDLSPALDQEA